MVSFYPPSKTSWIVFAVISHLTINVTFWQKMERTFLANLGGFQGRSIGRFTSLVQTELPQQLLMDCREILYILLEFPKEKADWLWRTPDFTSGINMCGFEWNVSISIRRSPWNSVQTSMSPAGWLAITLVMLQLSAVQCHGVWLNSCKASDISFYIITIPASKLHVSIRC